VITRGFRFLKQFPPEALVWFIGLISLAWLTPGPNHFTICPFNHLGLDFCPGCGLGTSVSYFLHGEVSASLDAHPLGIIAFFILLFRILELTKHHLKTHGTRN
jgi:hypothetical protein